MIYFNNQLMPTDSSAILFMVNNPIPFESYEDHQTGIFIRLHDLIAWSLAEGDDPISLIEEYLDIVYMGGHTVDEIANYLLFQDSVQNALWGLKENWSKLDETVPNNSLMYGGIAQEEATQLYAETTLRKYLEILSTYNK